MITFKLLQEEQREWVARNFPGRTNYMPLLGLIEEIGELAHAQLKGEQGIRYTPEQVIAKKKDAVGDIIVYLADYCSANDIDLQLVSELVAGYAITDDPLFAVVRQLGYICHDHGYASSAIRERIGLLLIHLGRYCDNNSFVLLEAVEYTWSKVKQRDWIANPMNANAKVEGSL